MLLLSTYEMGRQPFGLASPAAWLREAGCGVTVLDLSRQPLDAGAVSRADLVAIYLPMHTATRLAGPVIARVRAINPAAHLCAYGLYAPLNAAHLRALGVQTILGAEYEADLVELATELATDRAANLAADASSIPLVRPVRPGTLVLPRLAFRVPDREGLPPLSQYARLHVGPMSRTVGYTEATRGCKHLCRHCPIVPIYGGQFRVVPIDVAIADVRQQVAAGASHITFGDPDFFNGPRHAMAVVERLAADCPGVSYDVTIKIEHLLRHRALLSRLRETGCLFVTSAVEAVDDRILDALQKGHTRADFVEAVALCRDAGLTLVPTFVAFTPWTTIDGYGDLLAAIRALDLIEQVPSIQLAIRLLIPEGSPLLALDDVRALVGPFDAAGLVHPWRHPDARVDALQQAIAQRVGRAPRQERRALFDDVEAMARAAGDADGQVTTRLEWRGATATRRADSGDREAARLRVRESVAGGADTASDRQERERDNELRGGRGATSQTPGAGIAPVPPLVRAAVPYLDEPWYC